MDRATPQSAADAGPRWHERALAWLHGGVIAAYVLAIGLGLFLPVYTDEIGWRFQERAGFDGVDKMYSDGCGPGSLARPPWWMMPLRIASATLNGTFAAPVWVRLSGILYALLWGAALLMLCARIARDRGERLALGTLGLGLLCLANTPLLLVMSRPEQPIVLAVIAAVLIVLPRGDREPGGRAWPRVLAILLLAGVALAYHVKALMTVPLFGAALLYAGTDRRRIVVRAAGIVVLAAMTLSAMHYWADRLACPGDAILRAEYARNSAGVALAELRSPADLLPVLSGLWRHMNPFAYVRLAAPEPLPLSEWLPPLQIGRAASRHWQGALTLAWSIALALAAIGLLGGLARLLRRRLPPARVILSLAVAAAVFGWGATRLMLNFYEASFMLPLMTLAVVLALGGTRLVPLRFAATPAAILLGIAGIVSVLMTIGIWRASLTRAWGESGYTTAQTHSVAIANFDRVRRDVAAARRLCGIPPPEQAQGLMIDDVTYFPMMAARLPQHQLGVVGLWRGTIADPIAYLQSRRSSGALVSCRLLPADLMARAQRSGDICCLAPPRW